VHFCSACCGSKRRILPVRFTIFVFSRLATLPYIFLTLVDMSKPDAVLKLRVVIVTAVFFSFLHYIDIVLLSKFSLANSFLSCFIKLISWVSW
jgi:hypothetical protein